MEVSDPGIHSVAIFMGKMGKKDSKAVTAGGIPTGLSGGIPPAVVSHQVQAGILILDVISFLFYVIWEKGKKIHN